VYLFKNWITQIKDQIQLNKDHIQSKNKDHANRIQLKKDCMWFNKDPCNL